jgi:hypothetical protein
MPLWEDFINSLKGAAKGIASLPGAIIGNVASSGAQFGAAQTFKGSPEAAAAAGIAAETGTQKSLQKAGLSTVEATGGKIVDPILYTAQKAEQYVFSPIIARPISTAFLLTDPTSRLYKSDEYGKGFQFSDVIDAYERSGDEYKIINGEKFLVRKGVSLGVSMLKSYISPLGAFESLILKNGGIDVANVDLWDDAQVQKNFEENTLGRWITGTNDFLIKNIAINIAGGGLAAGVRASALKAGLNTRFRAGDVDAMPKAEDLINQHIAFRKSNGTEGNLTVFGQDIEDLAISENIIDITRIVNKHSNNSRLPALIKDTKDPEFVRDLILADKAYAPAVERLASAGMRDDLWVLGDGNLVIQGNYITTGQLPRVTPENSSRVFGAFDDAIKKNPKHQEIYDAFLKEVEDPNTGVISTEPTFFGKNYKPVEPILGREGFAAARSRAGKIRTAAIERDFSNVGGFTQTVLSPKYINGPTTVLIRTFGTMMPKGFITNSGIRPQNGIDELIATFDDVPLFTRGDRMIENHEGIPMTVSQYRTEMIDKFVSAKTDGERAAMVKNLNVELTRAIAFTRGFRNTELIDTFTNNLLQDVYTVHGNLSRMGTALDPTGVRIQVAPKVQAQLANSMPTLPFGEFDRLLARAARREKNIVTGGIQTVGGTARDSIRGIFELGNKAFSISALYRFSYIPKNSIFEPMLAATMAEGSKFVTTMFGSAAKQIIKNNANFVIRNIEKSKTILPNAKNEIQKEIKALSQQYDMAVTNRDITYAKYEQLFADVPGVSPATKREWADVVKEDLRAAEKMVDFIEVKLNKYTVEYGKPIDVPSLYNLRRRVQTLKDLPVEARAGERYASEIRSAELLIAKASQTINTLAPEINALDALIATKYAKIGEVLEELGPKVKKRGEIFSVAEGRYEKKPLLPEMESIVLQTGQVIEMPSMRNRNYLGDGYFSEISSSNTRTIEILGNKATVAKFNTIFRNGPQTITNVADPMYFDELAYVVNNFMRGDMLVDQVLAGNSRQTILSWAASNQGKSYANSMGRPVDQLTDMVDEAFSYVNRYLPTKDAQILAAAGPVRKTDLEQLLGDKLDQMVGIQPIDIPYGNPTGLIKATNQAIDASMANAWKFLLKPENLIREVYGTIDFKRRMTEKANMLTAQGREVTLATILSMRQSVAAEMVDNISNTFYTIPRQQRGLYLARALATFPNAAASGIYRYAGFAVKQPGRMGGFLNSYYGLYNSFGVDKYGNPVENPMDAEFLLIPGTKEMGFNDGKGMIISARATNFIANLPGPAYTVPLAIGRALSWKVSTEDEIKKSIDETVGRIPGYSYDELFPFGIETDLKTQLGRTFTPAWARNLFTAFNKSKTDEMWVNSLLSEATRQQILHEMEIGPKPTEESIRKGTESIYLRKFRTQFFSLLGTPQYVESRPDALFSDYYYMLYDKYKAKTDPKTGKPFTEMQASTLAEDEFQKQMRLAGGADFPIDRLFTSGARDKVAYFPPSQKAYSRIYEDFSGLAKKLERLDPSLVGLMTADLPRDYNIQVSKFLNDPNATLPGGTILNSQLKTPQMVEDELTKSRLWKAYTGFKDDLNAAAKKAGYSSYLSVPELKDQLREYAETLGAVSAPWFLEYGGGGAAKDTAYYQSVGIKTLVNDKDFMKKFGNTQFWTHAKAFIEYRDSFGKARLDAPTGYKGAIEEQWQLYLEKNLSLWDPTLQRMITRYYSNDSLNIKEPKK